MLSLVISEKLASLVFVPLDVLSFLKMVTPNLYSPYVINIHKLMSN